MIFFIAATVGRITEVKGNSTFFCEKRSEISSKTEPLKFEMRRKAQQKLRRVTATSLLAFGY